MIRTELRKARKVHFCTVCRGRIRPGETYAFAVASPDHGDLANPGWWSLRECADCRRQLGRPIPNDTAPPGATSGANHPTAN